MHAREFVEEVTAKANPNDLVILSGDFNANGPTNIKEAKNYIEHL